MVPHLCTALLVVLSLHLDATLAECECGKNNLENRIIGGNESQVHEWPWQVFLAVIKINETNMKGCGGSLISPSWVLTAAHCVKPTPDDIIVIIGEHALNIGSETYHTQYRTVSKIIAHSSYDEDQASYDIAVIKLSHSVEYSHGISPVCLPTNLRTQMFVGENTTAAGWGRTSNNGTVSHVVLDVTLPIISNTECENMFLMEDGTDGFIIRDDQICTYDGARNVCSGDSGGALVWLDDRGHYQQIGIASFVKRKGCAGKNRPGAYTRVTSFIDWIEEKTNTHFCSP